MTERGLHSWLVGELLLFFFPHHTAIGRKSPGPLLRFYTKTQWSTVAHCYWVTQGKAGKEDSYKKGAHCLSWKWNGFSYLFENLFLCCLQACFKCQLLNSLWSRLFIFPVSTTCLYSWDLTQTAWRHIGRTLSPFSCWDSHINHPDVKVSMDSEILLMKFTLVSRNTNVYACLLMGDLGSSNNFKGRN